MLLCTTPSNWLAKRCPNRYTRNESSRSRERAPIDDRPECVTTFLTIVVYPYVIIHTYYYMYVREPYSPRACTYLSFLFFFFYSSYSWVFFFFSILFFSYHEAHAEAFNRRVTGKITFRYR